MVAGQPAVEGGDLPDVAVIERTFGQDDDIDVSRPLILGAESHGAEDPGADDRWGQ